MFLKEDALHYYPENSDSKRSAQEEVGPFWANRGKKDPTYVQDMLYVDEPYWVFIRRDDPPLPDAPFLGSRGKKETSSYNSKLRYRQELLNDIDSPFYAARGKKPCKDKSLCEEPY